MMDFKAAGGAHRRVTELAPSYAPFDCTLGNVFVTRAAFKDPIYEYSRALELAPLAPDGCLVHVNRSMTLVEPGQLAEALDDLNVADHMVPGRPEVLSNSNYV